MREHSGRGVAQPLGPGLRERKSWAKEVIAKVAAAVSRASADMRQGDDRIWRGHDRVQHQPSQGYRRKGGRPTESGRPERPPSEGAPIRRRPVPDPDGGGDARGLPPLLLTWGDNASPPYPEGFPKMSADFPARRRALSRRCTTVAPGRCSSRACAGDIRPNLPGDPYRCADEADIQWAGRDLGAAVVRGCRPVDDPRGAVETADDLQDPLHVGERDAPRQRRAGRGRADGDEDRPVPAADHAR